MIDWVLAEWIAARVAGDSTLPAPAVELAPIVSDAQTRVSAYTGLVPSAPVPAPELVSRHEWASANLRSSRALFDPILEHAAAQLSGKHDTAAHLWLAVGTTAELGVLLGYMGKRVLGQYELILLPERADGAPPRLLFVAPNLAEAIVRFDADPREFITWVALHEVTHAVQFGGVPWLQDHLGGIIRRLLDHAEERMTEHRRLHLPSRETLARVGRAAVHLDMVGMVASAPERELVDQAQAVMAVIEGHAEHVMDAVAPELLPSLPKLRRSLDERRKLQTPLSRVISRLLGLEMKLKQYERGKLFCDEIVRLGGPGMLGELFTSPQALPTLAEIEAPAQWLARTRQ